MKLLVALTFTLMAGMAIPADNPAALPPQTIKGEVLVTT